MTWMKVDDTFHSWPQVAAVGPQGLALWLIAGSAVAGQKEGTDGLVHAHTLRVYASIAQVQARKASGALVAAGLWHDSSTIGDCPKCSHIDIAPGEFLFHDWGRDQITNKGSDDPVEFNRDLRNKRLRRDKALCALIRQRDRDLCRYCGKPTRWDKDRKSALSGTYDHIDPWGENTPENVVVACRRCNGVKKDRTPEEAGMVLLEPGTDLAGSSRITVISGPDHADISALARETGPGQIGLDPGPGPDPDSGLIGSDRVPAMNGSGPSTNGEH